jgi:hypothetical protein
MDMAIEIATFYFERYDFVMWGNEQMIWFLFSIIS